MRYEKNTHQSELTSGLKNTEQQIILQALKEGNGSRKYVGYSRLIFTVKRVKPDRVRPKRARPKRARPKRARPKQEKPGLARLNYREIL